MKTKEVLTEDYIRAPEVQPQTSKELINSQAKQLQKAEVYIKKLE